MSTLTLYEQMSAVEASLEVVFSQLDLLSSISESLNTTGISASDVIGIESISDGNPITTQVGIAFFTPDRTMTGVEYSIESIVEVGFDLIKRAAKAVFEFLLKISKALIALLDAVIPTRHFSKAADSEAKASERFNKTFNTGLHGWVIRNPAALHNFGSNVKALQTFTGHLTVANARFKVFIEDMLTNFRKTHIAGLASTVDAYSDYFNQLKEAIYKPVSLQTVLSEFGVPKMKIIKPTNRYVAVPIKAYSRDVLKKIETLKKSKRELVEIGFSSLLSNSLSRNDVEDMYENNVVSLRAVTNSIDAVMQLTDIMNEATSSSDNMTENLKASVFFAPTQKMMSHYINIANDATSAVMILYRAMYEISKVSVQMGEFISNEPTLLE